MYTIQVAGYDNKSFGLLVRHFWHRLIGTCGCWFCNDFMIYGNATFRTVFIGYDSYFCFVVIASHLVCIPLRTLMSVRYPAGAAPKGLCPHDV